MNGLTKVKDDWIPLQKKVFTRWVNYQLHDKTSLTDITKDLSNGVALVELAKMLTRKDTPRTWKNQPKRAIDMVMNCDMSIEMFTKDGVKLVGISGKDVNDNNEKLVLGLIWTLIMHYTIGEAAFDNDKNNNSKVKNQKQLILKWANERLANYPNINNFAPYSLMLCALLDSYVPDKINYFSLNPDDFKNNTELAIKTMKDLKIPVFVNSDEIMKYNNKVDEKSLLTQLSIAKVVLDNYQNSLQKSISSKKSDNTNHSNVKNSKLQITLVSNFDFNSEMQNNSLDLNVSELDVNITNELIDQLKKQLAKVEFKNQQLQTEFYQSEKRKYELTKKLAESEKINKEESSRLSDILTESEKYKIQLEAQLLDSEKELKTKKNLEIVVKKLATELKKTKIALESYQKRISDAIEAKEKMAAELKAMKIAHADSEANNAALKEAFEIVSSKIADEKELNDKYNSEIKSMKISQAKSEANAESFKKALHVATEKVKAQEEAKNKAIKELNEKAEAKIAANEKAKKEAIAISLSQQEELKKSQQENKKQLNAYYKLWYEFDEVRDQKERAEIELKEVRFTDCQIAGIISSLRIAKERAEKQAAEYKEAKEKAEKQLEIEKNEKIRARTQIENMQATMKRSLNKAQFEQEQKEKAEAEADFNRKATNKALSSIIAIRRAKTKAEKEAATLKMQKELAEQARIQAEIEAQEHKEAKIHAERKAAKIKADKEQFELQTIEQKEALDLAKSQVEAHEEAKAIAELNAQIEREEKNKIKAELNEQLKEKENLVQQTKVHIQAAKKSEAKAITLSKALSKAQKEAKSKEEALKQIKKDAEMKENSHKQALLIAESEAERLGRALVFAESEAKRLSNELAKAKLKASTEIEEKTAKAIKEAEIQKNARIHAEYEAKILSEALADTCAKAKAQGHPVDGTNIHFPKGNFGLTMTLKKSDYNCGKRVDVNRVNPINDETITLALTLVKDDKPFLNQSGLKLDLTKNNIEYDHYQQFAFGRNENEDTIINSFVKNNMVWDVADQFCLNPPEGTPFYLFPAHGRHNQHFLYLDGMIYAQQNGHVVTYVGGQVPFVMMAPSQLLKDRQTFEIKFF